MRHAVLALLGALLFGGASAVAADCPDYTLAVDIEGISDADRDGFQGQIRQAIDSVCRWWGPAFDGAFTVHVKDSRGPSMALVPAWRGSRGDMLFRAGVVRRGEAATVHEVVHVFAPNANRFLAEGLAVYAHEYLNGPSAYPNFGEDLHRAAKPLAATADIATLEQMATPVVLALDGRLDGKQAYIVAGSFVRFLIERHGMDRFRSLYELTPLRPGERDAGSPERWGETIGIPLEQAIAEWRDHLSAL
jgi:hypothetical protein